MSDAPPPPRPRRRLLRALGGALLLLTLLLAAVGIGIDSDAGHRFIADRIDAIRPSTGLRIHVGRIDGSIWRRVRIRDLRLSDPRGVFLEAPEIALDWRPLRWVQNRLHVDRLASDRVVLHRLPALRRSATPGPIIPNYAIHLGRVDLRLRLDPAVAGASRLVRLTGRADTARGRAIVALAAATTAGDRLALALDTEPDRDVFDLDARLDAPAGGVIPVLLGLHKRLTLRASGDGRWTGWHGRARLAAGSAPVGDLALTQARGRYALSGRVVPGVLVTGKADRLTAPAVRIAGAATYADRRIAGSLRFASSALVLRAGGALDLARSTFDPLRVDAALRRPQALFPNMTGRDIRLAVVLSGAFRRPAFRYALTAPRLAFDTTGFEDVRAQGSGRAPDHGPLALPLRLSARRVTGLGSEAGGILADLSVTGTLAVTPQFVTGKGLVLRSDKLSGRLALFVDLVTGRYGVDVSGGLTRYLIPNLGIVDVLTELGVRPTPDARAAVVEGRARAWVRRFDNPFLRGLAGGLPVLESHIVRGADGSLRLDGLTIAAPSLRIAGTGTRRRDGSFQFTGGGTHTTYGPFRLTLDGLIDHPAIRLALDHPADALGLAQVRVALDPVAQGFATTVAGDSALGPFALAGSILTPPTGAAMIAIDRLAVSGTVAKGRLAAQGNGLAGTLGVAGGGIAGRVDLTMAGDLQRIRTGLDLRDATLAGPAALLVRRGRVDADVLLDPRGTRIDARIDTRGLKRGSIFLARVAADVHLAGERGKLTASVAGSRGRAFAFRTDADLGPGSYVVRGQGQVDGRAVTLTTPASFRRDGDGWRLDRTALTYGDGAATVAGRFGGTGAQSLDATLDRLPLQILDMLRPGLGLGGAASGTLAYARPTAAALPSGRATLRVRGLTRSGLVLSSAPVDLGLDALLSGDRIAARAVAASGGRTIGRAQVALGPLPAAGDLADRIAHAAVFGQLRYQGPVDTPWRLTGIETIDLSGPVAVGADIGGTVDRPTIRGSLATTAMRLESTTTGTVVDRIRAHGRFDGSRLVVDRFDGATREGGTLSGRAAFDFGGLNGLGIDVALDADKAVLLNRDDIGATVTGALRLRSDGRRGAISGNVRLDRSSYRFGSAATAGVPQLPVTEINRPADVDVPAPPEPWTLDLVADARNQMFVRGLGLDSEWRAKLTLRGDVTNPLIEGRADLVRGRYQFAGRRFDLDRGIIRFTGTQPVDPALDIVASASVQGVSASLHVGGTGTKPQLDFTSTPALPEDELLSRLLFGTSIANLSAPEALQLAGAVNGLRTGGKGGLDPINAIRRVAGLDRLRIEAADVTTGQKTSIAAGKYLGRRTYVELVTDGQGYSATRVEFQVTRWLSLLSTVSTIGRQSANVRVSKDY